MATDALSAANAYRNQLKLLQNAGDSTDDANASSGAGGSSFVQMVKDAINGATDTQHQSEAVQLQSLTTGKVDLNDLVTAVSQAELSLNTIVAVRDRVINAYQDIIKMSI